MDANSSSDIKGEKGEEIEGGLVEAADSP